MFPVSLPSEHHSYGLSQDSVTVVGYPLGGDTISVTKGVVSRIEVLSLGSISFLYIVLFECTLSLTRDETTCS